eukprot:TRINITY_DN3872_c0_g1_i7.p1 TRINITY_DN3872_c0_g1~~TRINITY_DN3872_c0_g1_i7.p1  ORF type:complete len:444 (+),score=49.47 TRINITY_DN3872_c0_g1_i7:141-1472(+)
MFGGFLLFNADTGAPLYHRRFLPGFGLPGAKHQPALADPTGLALQLFAFCRFSRDLPNQPQLEQLDLGNGLGSRGIYFASQSFQDSQNDTAVLRITLVAFGDFPAWLGVRISSELLRAILLENAPPDAITPFFPASWRFKSLSATLEGVVDWLVESIAAQLAFRPQWLCVFLYDDDKTDKNCAKVSDIAVSTPTPRPPTEPPPAGHGRPSLLARRLLQRIPGGTLFGGTSESARSTPSQPANCRASSAPSRSQGAHKESHAVDVQSGASTPRTEFIAQGKVSWWHWRRGRSSQPPDRCGELCKQPNTCCYLYSDSSLADDSKKPAAHAAAGLASAVACSTSYQETTWFLTNLQQEHCPCADPFECPTECVGFTGEGMSVVVPVSSILPTEKDQGEESLQAACRACRFALDPDLRLLASWLRSSAAMAATATSSGARRPPLTPR